VVSERLCDPQSCVVFLIVRQHLALQASPRTVPLLVLEHGELDSGVRMLGYSIVQPNRGHTELEGDAQRC
jgi:hypothetical protein